VSDKLVIACGLEPLTPGSVPLECSKCNAKVWASPATFEKIQEVGEHDIVCIHCIPPIDKKSLLKPTDAQRDEIRRQLGRDVSDEEIDQVVERFHQFLSSRHN